MNYFFQIFTHLANWIVFDLLAWEANNPHSLALHFFIEDTTKIWVLVLVVVTLVALVRTFFPVQKIHAFLTHHRLSGYFFASIFGAITPFCSCSSIPLFIGFLESGLPTGLAFTFLATSPLVNEVAFVILWSGFGWEIATLYAGLGIFLGIVVGILLNNLARPQDLIIVKENAKIITAQKMPTTLKLKIIFALRVGKNNFKKLWWIIALGVALGAVIHGYIPQEFFAQYLSATNFWTVPLAVLIGVPIYAGCSTVAPVVVSLAGNGLSLGTALAFMMSIAGLSLPEAVLLRSSISTRLIFWFFGIVALGIIFIGIAMNLAELYL